MSTIDRLNIPAFKRKNELKRKARRKHLILTALDRKRAGLPLSAGIEVPAVLKATIPQLRTMAHVAKLEYTAQESIPLGKKSIATVERERRKTLKKVVRRKRAEETIAMKVKNHPLGVVTHFYEKINVAVIRLSQSITAGDELIFENFQQIADSIQIDRKSVKKAAKGQEIGLKLHGAVSIGELVYKN